ncbi:MAG TPA: hypothetical protein VG738_18130 [Chitinophagaceae bacterium]|nr:hypothetical protein [Chitinophagaceae bacterium]
MRKTVPCLFVFLAPLLLFAQHTYSFLNGKGPITWALIEKKVPRSTMINFVKSLPAEFSVYRTNDQYSPTLNDLYKKLHFIDINGDNNYDVIFEGQSGGEAREVEIFLFTKKGYVKALEEMEGLSSITFENGLLKQMVISDWGCCEDYINFDKTFNVSISKEGYTSFTLVLQTACAFQGTVPDSMFEKPFAFEVLNDAYNLRSRPVIDNISYEPWWEADTTIGRGNTLAKLPQGAKGIALGKHTDDTGREWWYVEIDENVALLKSVFYGNDNKFPTKKRGWISSRFVKRL